MQARLLAKQYESKLHITTHGVDVTEAWIVLAVMTMHFKKHYIRVESI